MNPLETFILPETFIDYSGNPRATDFPKGKLIFNDGDIYLFGMANDYTIVYTSTIQETFTRLSYAMARAKVVTLQDHQAKCEASMKLSGFR